MSRVLDSSATLAWVYPEETTDAIADLFVEVQRFGAWVPVLWRLEIANSVAISLRRGRHDQKRRDIILTNLLTLPIWIDEETLTHAWSETLQLADTHRLTVYDACYLELAVRRGLPLATLDGELRRAASAEGVVVLGQ